METFVTDRWTDREKKQCVSPEGNRHKNINLFWFAYIILFYNWTVFRMLVTSNDEGVRVMVFNTIFNNVSVISWRSVLLMEETRVPGENHRHWQTLWWRKPIVTKYSNTKYPAHHSVKLVLKYTVELVQSNTWVFRHPVISKNIYGPKVFLLTKIKPEYSDILYNPDTFPWSLDMSD